MRPRGFYLFLGAVLGLLGPSYHAQASEGGDVLAEYKNTVPLASAQTAPPGNGNPADYAGTEERQITGTADLEKEEDDDEDSFCGFDYTVDRSLAPTEPGRQRRQIAMYGNKWGKKHLTYRIINAPQGDDAERYRVQNTITRALKLWSDASPLSFYQAKEDEEADIMVKFTRGDHSDGYPFDGKGGVFAHAFFPHDGDVHFDDDEPWALDNYVATSRKDLYIIAAHELGHSLGLGHSDAWGALMRPKYTDVKWMKTISALPPEDRNAIQAMYGPCPRLEWNVRYMLESSRRSGRAPKQTRPNTCSAPYDAIFRGPDRKTYAMRGLYYWRLNDGNEIGRPMPLLIRHRWPGLPGNINAAVTSAYTGRTYFFKGNRIWRFKDSILDEYFPISHNETGLPRSPDAAFVWGPKHKIVVFKRSKFYIWNEFNRKVEPGYPKLIRKFFPGLPNNIDAAFQWKNRHTFFFKQGYYWRYDDEIGSIAKCYPRPVALYWSGCGGTSWERKQL
ncbi:matrix metalloproteinase-28-like [Branchiostoma floridae]|uniref:Matrix metalloproteinase-28-like n=1 Tax=Branchiostoma floridae TaxID=7739 RepID=A0A9J7HLX3_BRAFL|nr:matrix metalloproteinase-28-like [Branchiostoma floridae]